MNNEKSFKITWKITAAGIVDHFVGAVAVDGGVAERTAGLLGRGAVAALAARIQGTRTNSRPKATSHARSQPVAKASLATKLTSCKGIIFDF